MNCAQKLRSLDDNNGCCCLRNICSTLTNSFDLASRAPAHDKLVEMFPNRFAAIFSTTLARLLVPATTSLIPVKVSQVVLEKVEAFEECGQ